MNMFEQIYETEVMTESHEREERRRLRRRRDRKRERKEREKKKRKAPCGVATPVPLTGFAAILMAPKVTNAVLRAFMTRGWRRRQDLEDLLGEVRLGAVKAFHRGVRPPDSIDQMCCFCVKIARNQAASVRRKEGTARKNGHVGLCEEPDEELPLEDRWEGRDPVDAQRQLEVAAELFRQGRMPEHGVEILYNEAAGAKWKDIGADVGISDRAVQGRLKTMRKAFAREIDRRGMG